MPKLGGKLFWKKEILNRLILFLFLWTAIDEWVMFTISGVSHRQNASIIHFYRTDRENNTV